MDEKFIAYEGICYTVEWYFDNRNRSKAKEYFLTLPFEQKKKALNLFKLLAMTGEILNEEKFRYEGDKIYAFKPKPDRFLCFFYEGKKVIITNAFEKKEDKLLKREKLKAIKAKADYIKRYDLGIYYV